MKRVKICLACSPGGHWRQMQLAIGNIPEEYDCYWLTQRTKTTVAAMKDQEHVFVEKFLLVKKWTILVNAIQSLFWLIVKRPDVIISTGAGDTIPTIYLGKKFFKTKIIYITSAANVTESSKAPLWAEKYSDVFCIQWDEMKEIFPKAINIGVL